MLISYDQKININNLLIIQIDEQKININNILIIKINMSDTIRLLAWKHLMRLISNS